MLKLLSVCAHAPNICPNIYRIKDVRTLLGGRFNKKPYRKDATRAMITSTTSVCSRRVLSIKLCTQKSFYTYYIKYVVGDRGHLLYRAKVHVASGSKVKYSPFAY